MAERLELTHLRQAGEVVVAPELRREIRHGSVGHGRHRPADPPRDPRSKDQRLVEHAFSPAPNGRLFPGAASAVTRRST